MDSAIPPVVEDLNLKYYVQRSRLYDVLRSSYVPDGAQVQLPNGEPLQLKLGMHCGMAFSGMLGMSPPHFQCVTSPLSALLGPLDVGFLTRNWSDDK